MWDIDKLKTSRIVKYTLFIFALVTALSTFTSMVTGIDNTDTLSFDDYVKFQLLLPSMLVVAVYALMAKRDATKPWSYAVTVFTFDFILGFLILSLLMHKLYISPTWFVDFPMSAASAVAGTLIGVNLGSKSTVAKKMAL